MEQVGLSDDYVVQCYGVTIEADGKLFLLVEITIIISRLSPWTGQHVRSL